MAADIGRQEYERFYPSFSNAETALIQTHLYEESLTFKVSAPAIRNKVIEI